MPILSLKGYLKDMAPDVAEVVALWAYTYWTGRETFWRFEVPEMCEHVESVLPRKGFICKDFYRILPWYEKVDSLWELKPKPFKKLKYVYIFANPDNRPYLSSMVEIDALLVRCFDSLKAVGIKSVALIHIPASSVALEHSPFGERLTGKKTDEDDLESARQMILSIQNWMNANGEMDVYLIDRLGDFEKVL